MNLKRFPVLLLLVSLILFGLWLPANAAPAFQNIFTPTAGADGRIIYVVQAGDTCIRVALLNGISVEQLRTRNSNLDAACTLIAGQQLLIDLVGPAAATSTAGPSPTPLPPTLTPTPFTGTTELCVLLFDDKDGNALRATTEPAIAGGAVSLTETNGKYSATKDTVINPDPAAYQGICFSDIPEGHYNVSVGLPDNYNATMEPAYSLDAKAGGRYFVDFGAQSTAATIAQATNENPNSNPTFTLFGILGAVLLLGGAGLAWYAYRMGRPESKFSGGSNLFNRKK
jgi:murein DD-endopeptidase MepM/ murein hydrolase activator NlpD